MAKPEAGGGRVVWTRKRVLTTFVGREHERLNFTLMCLAWWEMRALVNLLNRKYRPRETGVPCHMWELYLILKDSENG